MKLSRHLEPSGLVVTHFGGRHSCDDARNALSELVEMTRGSSAIYEIIVHEDDIELDVCDDEIASVREEVKSTFQNYQKGALAFVAKVDLVFGLCRQLEFMMDNAKIAVSVFRSEELARKWIDEIRSIHDEQ